MLPDVDPQDLVDPERFARNGYPHTLWTRLRAEAPVAQFAPPGFRPFWAVTKHADVAAILSQPLRFSSEYGILLARADQPPVRIRSEMIVMIDPPRHRPLRKLASPRFTPRAVQARRADIERIAARILGMPDADWQLLFRWTNEVIGHDDPEFRRAGETPAQTYRCARGELRAYLERLIEQRRASPGDDLVSQLLASESSTSKCRAPWSACGRS